MIPGGDNGDVDTLRAAAAAEARRVYGHPRSAYRRPPIESPYYGDSAGGRSRIPSPQERTTR